MTGPVTRWLRRPVFWTAGWTVADVLLVVGFGIAGSLVIVLLLIAAAYRSAP